MLKNKSLEIGVTIKAASGEEGSFTAYGNAFGNVDHAGDKTMPGAFAKCISQYKEKGRMPRLLGQHGHRQNPIGIITDMKEDDYGLYFEGNFCLDTQAGREAYALVKMGAMDMFSIGYKTINEKMVNGINELHELDVKEISLVTFACNENSLIQSVKEAVEAGENPIRLVQKSLQEFGFSKRTAEAAVNAIKQTQKAEDDMKSILDAFKAKMENHKVTDNRDSSVEVKADETLGDFVGRICKAARNVVGGEYSYAYALYTKFVIMEVCEETEDGYTEKFVRVPYTAENDEIMVGEPVEVVKLVKWVTPTEMAEFEGKSKEAPVEEKGESATPVETEEKLAEETEEAKEDEADAESEEPGSEETKTETEEDEKSESLIDALKSEDFTSWFK